MHSYTPLEYTSCILESSVKGGHWNIKYLLFKHETPTTIWNYLVFKHSQIHTDKAYIHAHPLRIDHLLVSGVKRGCWNYIHNVLYPKADTHHLNFLYLNKRRLTWHSPIYARPKCIGMRKNNMSAFPFHGFAWSF